MVVIYIFILIIGQSGSGKSAFAEKKVVEFGDYINCLEVGIWEEQ